MSDTSVFEILIKTNIYRKMMKRWIIPQLALVIGELGAILLIKIIPPKPIALSLPPVNVPSLGFSEMITNLFTATISINGIILGFTSVCMIYFRKFLEDIVFSYEERMEKTNIDKSKRDSYAIRKEAFSHVFNHFSRFAKNYVTVSLFAMFIQLLIFTSGFVSGYLAIAGLIFNLHACVLVLSGLHPIIHTALWHG